VTELGSQATIQAAAAAIGALLNGKWQYVAHCKVKSLLAAIRVALLTGKMQYVALEECKVKSMLAQAEDQVIALDAPTMAARSSSFRRD
jgi:hypothetical protein